MNILEALEVALPELPGRTGKQRYPQLDSRVIAREHIEQGAPTVLAKMPGAENFIRLPPSQWKLVQLFDGQRSYRDISDQSSAVAGVFYSEAEVRQLANFFQENSNFFYKTPLEENVTLHDKLRSQRQHRRSRFSDLSEVPLLEWKHADDYLTRIQPKLKFIYTRWFTLLTLGMFALMFYLWLDRFQEIWRDSFEYYNFTDKGIADLIEFWFFFGAMAFIHETAHGLTCKNFGGKVEKMGFILMYFAPTFYCDVTQIWIYGDRWERVATVMAGIWADLMICVAATIVWWATPAGMPSHDLAYKVMMVTGIGVSLLNLNPLIKLDGYYLFSELTGEVDLKETTTAYVSSWVRRNIFRLPVEIEWVPRRRRVFYLIYALLSGVYSYGLLIVVVLFVYHVLRSYSPEWAFVPALIIAYFMFRKRIWSSLALMKTAYLDKKERLWKWLSPPRLAAVAVLTAVVLLAPVWPEFVRAQFILEPARRAIIRAQVPGQVEEVFIQEGEQLQAGQPVAQLSNLALQSQAARVHSNLEIATASAVEAQLRYSGMASAGHLRDQLAQQDHLLSQQVAELRVLSPISGVVTTPRPGDLRGSHLRAGEDVAEVAEMSTMQARIFVPEFAMRDVRLGAPVRLLPSSKTGSISGRLDTVAPASTQTDPSFVETSNLKGINLPDYYLATVRFYNAGMMREGQTGTAKIFVRRRSLAGLSWEYLRDMVTHRLW
ncbi:MAG TPA: HlyD family efflux transporter periplasmic adaptor subunit [Terriglobales bacterium]|nr:HlyD family efflux transporter periplasmic adaptor subunit [Terriglobales bacterium]